jgi:hypothetical protein
MATLILCPPHLVAQWDAERVNFTGQSLSTPGGKIHFFRVLFLEARGTQGDPGENQGAPREPWVHLPWLSPEPPWVPLAPSNQNCIFLP